VNINKKYQKIALALLTHVILRVIINSGGEGVTAKELKRKLAAAGWTITDGSRHELATHPDKPGVQVAIHRHTGDIPTGTLSKILKDAGLK
jgi:predicted RNA binding protein YcfA (HicA-like mRNA interferase family)